MTKREEKEEVRNRRIEGRRGWKERAKGGGKERSGMRKNTPLALGFGTARVGATRRCLRSHTPRFRHRNESAGEQREEWEDEPWRTKPNVKARTTWTHFFTRGAGGEQCSRYTYVYIRHSGCERSFLRVWKKKKFSLENCLLSGGRSKKWMISIPMGEAKIFTV